MAAERRPVQVVFRSGGLTRPVDFLASFGTELYPDIKKDEFQATRFRMVRSGDSNKQGMLSYAKANLEAVDRSHIERALFNSWDYGDDGSGLRWDPIEDRDHALRWSDPSASMQGVMLAANCLAVEALRCFPTFAIGEQAHTPGFMDARGERRDTALSARIEASA